MRKTRAQTIGRGSCFCCSDQSAEVKMELAAHKLRFASCFRMKHTGSPSLKVTAYWGCSSTDASVGEKMRKRFTASCALPETAASVTIAAIAVGAAASFLVRRTKVSEENEIPLKVCEDCSGSGICPECKGEGFVLKKLSEENAERARRSAKNMATRYTAGLPKKWSYCTKCSSSRSCITCGGTGKLSC